MLNMGKQISKYEYQKYGSDGVMKPIIFCCPDEELAEKRYQLKCQYCRKLNSVKTNSKVIYCKMQRFETIESLSL